MRQPADDDKGKRKGKGKSKSKDKAGGKSNGKGKVIITPSPEDTFPEDGEIILIGDEASEKAFEESFGK